MATASKTPVEISLADIYFELKNWMDAHTLGVWEQKVTLLSDKPTPAAYLETALTETAIEGIKLSDFAALAKQVRRYNKPSLNRLKNQMEDALLPNLNREQKEAYHQARSWYSKAVPDNESLSK